MPQLWAFQMNNLLEKIDHHFYQAGPLEEVDSDGKNAQENCDIKVIN